MGQDLIIPDAFKQPMASAFAKLNPNEESLADGIGQSYGVIRYRGKTWSLRYRGKQYDIVRPDDGSPSAFLDVVVLGQARHKSKSYFKQYTATTSVGERPICSSINGIVPDPDVLQKQSDTCALCPRNVFKTNPDTGRKSRECSDFKRLAVLILPVQTQKILGEPLLEPVFLRVPPASLNSLAIMGESMQRQGFHYSSFVTRITFDPAKAHPEMVFSPLKPLSDAEAPVVLQLRDEPIVQRITGEPAQDEYFEPPAAPPLTVVRETPTPPPQAKAELPIIDMSPTIINPAPPTAPPTIIPDAPVDSDAALDAHIASLVKKASGG